MTKDNTSSADIISQVEIKMATPSCVATAITLDHAAFSDTNTHDAPELIKLRQQTFPEGFLVCWFEKQIIGFISSEKWSAIRTPKMGESPADTHQPNGQILCITAMAIAERFRSYGIGAILLKKLLDVAKTQGCTLALVETVSAQHFYEKNGFTIKERVQDREWNAYVLSRNLI